MDYNKEITLIESNSESVLLILVFLNEWIPHDVVGTPEVVHAHEGITLLCPIVHESRDIH